MKIWKNKTAVIFFSFYFVIGLIAFISISPQKTFGLNCSDENSCVAANCASGRCTTESIQKDNGCCHAETDCPPFTSSCSSCGQITRTVCEGGGGSWGSCSGITFNINPTSPLPNSPVAVDMHREGATSCGGNWDNVNLKLDGVDQGINLCFHDGTNCDDGYKSDINSGAPGIHTLTFTVNNGACSCNSTTFTTLSKTMTVKTYIGQDWNFDPNYSGASCQFEGYINTCQAPYRQFAKTLACRPDGSGIGADGTVYFVGCKTNVCGHAKDGSGQPDWNSNNIDWNDVGTVGSGKSAEILGTKYLSWTNQISEATFTTTSYYANGYKVFWKPSDPARNYNLCLNALPNPSFGQVSGTASWHHGLISWSDPNNNFSTAVWMPVYSAAPTPTPISPTPTPYTPICNSPLPSCTLGTQILTNPTFDSNTTGWSPWTPQYTSANWERGAAHIHSDGPTGRSCWYQDIDIIGGKRIMISSEMFRSANMGTVAPYISINAYVNRGGTMVWENNYGGVTSLNEVNSCSIKSRDIYLEPAVSRIRVSFCVWDATAGESYANWVSVCRVPNRCGEYCTGVTDCATDACYTGVCRNSACLIASDCNCATCSCEKPGGVTPGVNPPTPTPTPIPAIISGRGTYLDINNNCTYEAGVDQIPADSTTYRLHQTAPASCSYDQTQTSANGQISYSNLGCFSSTNTATYQLTATYNNTDYQFICAGSTSNSAQFSINVTPGQNFPFSSALSVRRNGWIQGYGAEIYVGNSISNSIPSNAITRAFIRSEATMSSGVVSLPNSINLNSAPISSDSSKLWLARPYTQSMPTSVTYSGLYNSIITSRLFDVESTAGPVTWPSPTGSVYSDGVVVIRMTGDATINSNVNLNHRYILFVEGNLTINNTITLQPQGFLLIVTQGNILINSTLGTTPSSDTPTLEGLFITGGSFIANGGGTYTDPRLNIKGTIVTGVNGSGTYVSNRTHQQISEYPSDYFIFNPKLLLNAPRVLTSPIFSWNISRDE